LGTRETATVQIAALLIKPILLPTSLPNLTINTDLPNKNKILSKAILVKATPRN